MEDKEQNYKENGDTPNLVGQHLVHFVGLGHLGTVIVFALDHYREVLVDKLVTAVGNQRFVVGTEHFVTVTGLEIVNHAKRFFVHGNFDFVAFHKFDCMEQRIFNTLSLEGNANVVDKVSNACFAEHRRAFALFLALVVRLVHKFLKTGFLKCGDFDNGHTQTAFQFGSVDFVALLFHRVHHVESDYHRNVDFHYLRCEVQVTFQVGCVNNVDYAVGLFVQNVVTGNDFFRGVGTE